MALHQMQILEDVGGMKRPATSGDFALVGEGERVLGKHNGDGIWGFENIRNGEYKLMNGDRQIVTKQYIDEMFYPKEKAYTHKCSYCGTKVTELTDKPCGGCGMRDYKKL